MEDYEVNENRHSRNLSHVRETEGSYEGIDASALGGAVPNSNNSSTPGNGRGDGNRDVRSRIPKEKKEKKEKTDDQLARAAFQLKMIFFSYKYIYICMGNDCWFVSVCSTSSLAICMTNHMISKSKAIVKVNANLLEISQWEFKLKTAGVSWAKLYFRD